MPDMQVIHGQVLFNGHKIYILYIYIYIDREIGQR